MRPGRSLGRSPGSTRTLFDCTGLRGRWDVLTFRSVDPAAPYPKREAWLETTRAWDHQTGGLSEAQFLRNYERFDPKTEPSKAELALLTFVKANAGEAYGVEVVSRRRHGNKEISGLFDRVERVLGREETYHTRILVGAASQFGLQEPTGAWRPPAALKTLIAVLAYAPKGIFHPILLGAEIAGVYTFNWMLKQVGQVFADQPQVRDAMEARLTEILIDEIGHIAFNRLAVGPSGLAFARSIAPQVANQTAGLMPESKALGWDRVTADTLDQFDWASLPETVRKNSFFV